MCQQCEVTQVYKSVNERRDDVEYPISLCADCYASFIAEAEEQEAKALEKLELAKKIVAAMELGGRIEIKFTDYDGVRSKKQAEKLIKGVSESFGLTYHSAGEEFNWFSTPYFEDINITVHYSLTVDDKIANLEKQLEQLRKSDSHERTA